MKWTATEMLARLTAMPKWLSSSRGLRPKRSMIRAATTVPDTFTKPMTMLPRMGDLRPACSKTCRVRKVG